MAVVVDDVRQELLDALHGAARFLVVHDDGFMTLLELLARHPRRLGEYRCERVALPVARARLVDALVGGAAIGHRSDTMPRAQAEDAWTNLFAAVPTGVVST